MVGWTDSLATTYAESARNAIIMTFLEYIRNVEEEWAFTCTAIPAGEASTVFLRWGRPGNHRLICVAAAFNASMDCSVRAALSCPNAALTWNGGAVCAGSWPALTEHVKGNGETMVWILDDMLEAGLRRRQMPSTDIEYKSWGSDFFTCDFRRVKGKVITNVHRACLLLPFLRALQYT